MSLTPKKTLDKETEIHISFEDQQQINKFARLNNKYEDAKEEILTKKTEIQNLEDAISEMELFDDDDKILYSEGEIFLYKPAATALSSTEEYKESLDEVVRLGEKNIAVLKDQIDELKAHLYAKFGSNIHLEMEE